MNDLRSDILRGPTESSGGATRSNPHLAQTEVSNLDVTLDVEHHVVQLEVPVDHPVLVEEHDGDADLGSVESKDKREKKVGQQQSNLSSSTYVARGSLNLPDCCMWNMRSPPGTYSNTKYR